MLTQKEQLEIYKLKKDRNDFLKALQWYAEIGEIKSSDGLVTIKDGAAVAKEAIFGRRYTV